MTRVLLLIFLLIVESIGSSPSVPDSPSYTEALKLIESFSPYTSNLTEINQLLEYSMHENNPKAMSKLGEFWLLGFPISPENLINDPYIIDGKFNRNFDLAMYYFKKSLQKAPDSSFFISLIMSQSLLINTFDKYLPIIEPTLSTFSSLKQQGLEKLSPMTITSNLMNYERCSIAFPDFVKSSNFNYLAAYIYPNCYFDCKKIADLALIPATEALEYIYRNNRESIYLPTYDQENLFLDKNMKNRVRLFEKQVSNNYESLAVIGSMYIKGNPLLGFKPEIENGVDLLEKSASNGDVNANELLGIFYFKGIGVNKNLTKAFEYFQYAADKGSLKSWGYLGEMYLSGLGIESDSKKGLEILKNSAKEGDIESNSVLGGYYFMKKKYEKAFKHLEIGANSDDPKSLYYLGIMYLQGLGVTKSCEQALHYFKRLITKGPLGLYSEIAYSMYLNNDFEGAFLYNLISAGLGFENSILNLAYLYEHDLVPEKFKCKKGKEYCAAIYYALTLRSPTAIHKLGNLIAKGNEFFPGNYSEAMKYYQSSKFLPESTFALGNMYEYGLGVEGNLTRSIELYSEIIEKAENGQVDVNAKYPAKLALARSSLKNNEYFQNLQNLLQKATGFVSDLIQYLLP